MRNRWLSAAIASAFVAGVASSAPAAIAQNVTAGQGDTAFRQGRFEAAAAAYRAQLTANPNDGGALLGLARVALYENNLDDAQRYGAQAQASPANAAAAGRLLATVRGRREIAQSAAALDVPASGVSIPFIATDPLPLMQITINHHVANVLLDTGGPDVVVDPQFAAEAGLAVRAGDIGTFAGGRSAQVQRTTIPSVQAGSIVLHNVDAGVLPSRNLPFFGARKVDGVIGTVFLSRFLSTVDYPHHRLLLQPKSAAMPLNANAVTLPVWLVGDHFIFARGSVNGISDQLFLVDSGLAGGGFSPEKATVIAAHVRTFPDQAGTGVGGGGAVTFVPVIADTLCLATACQKDVHGMYTPQGSPLEMFPFAAAGAVSHTYLEHYAVTYDFVRMQMTLTPP